MERMQERFVRTDVDGVRFVAISNPNLLVLQLCEQTNIVSEPEAMPKSRCGISGLVAGVVEERRDQAAQAVCLAGLEIDAFAERMEEHPHGQLLAIAWMDLSIHQAALARVRCQAERW